MSLDLKVPGELLIQSTTDRSLDSTYGRAIMSRRTDQDFRNRIDRTVGRAQECQAWATTIPDRGNGMGEGSWGGSRGRTAWRAVARSYSRPPNWRPRVGWRAFPSASWPSTSA